KGARVLRRNSGARVQRPRRRPSHGVVLAERQQVCRGRHDLWLSADRRGQEPSGVFVRRTAVTRNERNIASLGGGDPLVPRVPLRESRVCEEVGWWLRHDGPFRGAMGRPDDLGGHAAGGLLALGWRLPRVSCPVRRGRGADEHSGTIPLSTKPVLTNGD